MKYDKFFYLMISALFTISSNYNPTRNELQKANNVGEKRWLYDFLEIPSEINPIFITLYQNLSTPICTFEYASKHRS